MTLRRIGLFERACRAILNAEFDRAARLFSEFSGTPLVQFGRHGRLDSPSPAEHPQTFQRIDAFLKRHPGSAWGRVFQAFARRAVMDYDGAIAAMETAVKLDPNLPMLWALLARLRFINTYPARGVRDLEKAVALAPRCGFLRSWLGEALRHRGRLREALSRLSEGIRLDPWYAPAYTWRSAVWEALGRAEKAREDLGEAVRRNPRDAWALHQRMRLRRELGDWEGALEDARRAHALNPKFGWISGRPGPQAARAALRESERALSRRPDWPWLRAWTGWTRMAGGDADGARRDLELACRRLRHPWPLAWLGRARHCGGRPKEALPAIDASLRRAPRYAQAHGWRGETLFALGDLRRAEASLSRALELDGVCSWAYYWRARTRAALGRRRPAREDAAAALKLNPDYPQALALQRELAA